MTARRVQVPLPRDLLSLTATGPISPSSATSSEAAELSLFDALADAAEDEASDTGWCCWWASPPRHSGHVARLDLWVGDDSGGSRGLVTARGRLEAAGFLVRSSGKRSTPAAIQRGDRPLHARLGAARVGQLAGDLAVVFELVDGIKSVHAAPRWRWPVQPCPSCGHEGHPVERVAGFPSPETQLAAAFGEVVFAGCLVEDDDDFDAQCARCGQGFRPREDTRRRHG